MKTNELLEEKWRVQEKLSKESHHNINTLLDNAELSVAKIIKEHNVTLHFTDRIPVNRTTPVHNK